MTQLNDEDAGPHVDVLGLIRKHFRTVIIATVVVTGIVAVGGAVYYRWIQARKQVASLEFRPTFNGAAQMKYPNDLPFSPNDVTAGAIIDLVFDGNNIGTFCNREAFRSGFFVEQRSDQSMFLDLEYQALLSQPRLDSVERRLLQEEHATKRRALPLQFRLVFVTHPACAGIPPVMVSKVMVDLLATWASESESKRGVLNHQVEVLTPSVLDVTVGGAGGAVLRADLLRTALTRIIDNVSLVAELPGATLIRLGPQRATFKEVGDKLSDLVDSKLDPLVMTSGGSLVRESSVWVNETVATAERDQKAAEATALAYQTALREFSGTAQASGAARASAAAVGASGGQTLVPQIDASFIDRIVAMSADNAKFRQEMTKAMVAVQIEAVVAQQRASYYRRLLQSAQQRSGSQITPQELDKRFNEIVAEGKALTKQFNDLYDEFSRVALRSAASLYQTDKPVAITMSQRFGKRSLLNVVAATFVGMLVLAFAFSVIRDRIRLEPR